MSLPCLATPKPRSSDDFSDDDLRLDQLEFALAIREYMWLTGNAFPTWSEVLGVLRVLGYRKVAVGEREPRPHSE